MPAISKRRTPRRSNPDEVFMREALSQVCPENMVKIAAYLEHNGVAGVKPAHVKDMAFWERLKAKDLKRRARRGFKRYRK